MMAGLTSPARPWFRLMTPDPALSEYAPVKEWLWMVEQRMRGVLRETDTSIVFSVGTRMADMERRMLLKTLSHFDNDKTAAARALGISVRTVHNHLARIAAEQGRPGCDEALA